MNTGHSEEIAHGLSLLETERADPTRRDLDLQPAAELVRMMIDDHRMVVQAVEPHAEKIAAIVERIVDGFEHGGRLIYLGAGTPGRLGILDASEAPPTFSVSANVIVGVIAGGDDALRDAIEGAEDDAGAGAADVVALSAGPNDVVVGISASGRTPYVLGALRQARSAGATTVAVSCNSNSETSRLADYAIEAIVGPEILAGSTRLKAGSAQKLILNIFSTASMIKWGKSYGNLMVDLAATNEKLRARAVRTVELATGVTSGEAQEALNRSNQSVKAAILALLTECDPTEADQLLERTHGRLRDAIQLRQS